MPTPFTTRAQMDAALMAAGRELDPAEGYGDGVPSASQLSGARYPSGRSVSPHGTAYHRMLSLYSGGRSVGERMSSLSGEMAARASAALDRRGSQEPEQSVVTNNTPAAFAQASFATSVRHSGAPLDRYRTSDILDRDVSRGIAF